MHGKKAHPADASELRRQAEELARRTDGLEPEDLEVLSPEKLRQVLHELRVHQIELEMQNEELRRAQAELDSERERYFDLYDMAPVGYCTLSDKGLIQQANLTAASMLGLARGVLLKRPFSRFILADDQEAYYLFRKKLLDTGQPQSCELRMVKQGGSTFWVRLQATIAREDGRPPVCRVVLSDISDRKQAEELRDHIERIIQHDLRSPAISAISIAKMFQVGTSLTKEQRRSLFALLEQSGQNMLDVLNSSLDLYKIESGQYQGKPQDVDCLALIREMLEALRLNPKHALIALELLIEGAPPAPCASVHCLGQPNLLRAALRNLTKNAIEASPEGQTVCLNLLPGKGCRIKIHNRGAVPKDTQERFFKKFATSGKSNGTGLGTYAAKMMIEAQGGSLEMRTSEEADETTLLIHMPA